MVVGQYNVASMGSGCWLTGITKVDENGGELPKWNYRYEESDCPYSPALLMDIPEGTCDLEWYIGGRRVEN